MIISRCFGYCHNSIQHFALLFFTVYDKITAKMITKPMKINIRIVVVWVVAFVLPALASACVPPTPSGSGTTGTPRAPVSDTPAVSKTPDSGNGDMTLGPEMTPLASGPPAVPIVLTPEAPGTKVESNEKAVIDYSNASDGYVMIKWTGGEVEKGLQVQILGPGANKYSYTLVTNSDYEVYPLSDGNGSYNILIAEILGDGRGAMALSTDINVTLVDEFAPFLHPNQYVNFNEDSNTVKKAAELVTANSDFIEKIAAIYEFVIRNISYDVDLANEIIAGKQKNYLPDVDAVLAKKKGICFDFAAVMAAMLRSQGIPTKLVVGDVDGGLRHAWLNVYSEEEGWIDAVIFFDGGQWKMMDPTFASSGAQRDFVGDGSNYVELYLY